MPSPKRLISVERSGQATVIHFHDEPVLGFSHARQLRSELGDALNAADPPWVVVDFGDVEYMGAVIIAELISARRLISERNGSLKLCGMYQNIRDIFRLMKVDQLFEIYDTCGEALQNSGEVETVTNGEKIRGFHRRSRR